MNRNTNYQSYYKTTPPPPLAVQSILNQPPPPPPPSVPSNPASPLPSGGWNSWPSSPPSPMQYQRNTLPYSIPPPCIPTRNEARSQNYFSSNNRYPSQQSRLNVGTTNGQYANQQNWNRNNKRQSAESPDSGYDCKTKPNKKKKKSLSQANPSKKDWTLEEAEAAWKAEKTFETRSKNSLIIKIPDPELTKEIVTGFHKSIVNVHFQQPSMARYCFVKIDEKEDVEKVIEEINKVKFGNGFLQAEHKKCLETEKNIGPQDIDPLTLFVGNLAQEVTKQDMVKTYPKQKRIDIGHAKKMKNTRYAFVQFHNAKDALEAFQNTHSLLLYSRSLIVRFRRLRGTIGMPGETKVQNEPKQVAGDAVSSTSISRGGSFPVQIENDGGAVLEGNLTDGKTFVPMKIKKERISDSDIDVNNAETLIDDDDDGGEINKAVKASMTEMTPSDLIKVEKCSPAHNKEEDEVQITSDNNADVMPVIVKEEPDYKSDFGDDLV